MSGGYLDFLRIAAESLPKPVSKWTRRYLGEIIDRGRKRIGALEDRIGGVTAGRTMPDLDQVTIGSGRRFKLALFFLDICSSSARPNWTEEEQKQVLSVMNVFMAEMINIARDFGGTYEKNTGDGLMVYFGEEAHSDPDRVQPAVEAAVVMHYVNDNLMTPWFNQVGWQPVRFRVGIDLGPVTIARVGIRGDENSFVAIGTPANIACKLMRLIPDGGICIGHDVYTNLPRNWSKSCVLSPQRTGFVYVKTGLPYPGWHLNHRLGQPLG